MLANTDLGTLSLMAYLVGASVAIWCFFGELYYVAATLHIVIVFVSGFAVDKDNFDVWWRGCFLGVVLSLGILLSSSGGPYFRYYHSGLSCLLQMETMPVFYYVF